MTPEEKKFRQQLSNASLDFSEARYIDYNLLSAILISTAAKARRDENAECKKAVDEEMVGPSNVTGPYDRGYNMGIEIASQRISANISKERT